MHILREASGLDHESIMIICLINAATMRTLLVGPDADPDMIDLAIPPEHARGGISRAAVADVLGISKETARRKINSLIEAGNLMDAGYGKVRPVPDLTNPQWQKVANDIHAAAVRYDHRLKALGCKGVGD